jgi:hypothetical protein
MVTHHHHHDKRRMPHTAPGHNFSASLARCGRLAGLLAQLEFDRVLHVDVRLVLCSAGSGELSQAFSVRSVAVPWCTVALVEARIAPHVSVPTSLR